MMKNMFGGELKSKKDQKNLEQILKTIVSTTKEKTKNEACLKLIEIFENTLEININFDYLLQSIDDLSECNSTQCRRIWLLIAMQIIKFRSEYRTKLFSKMMKVVFDLNIEDNALKIRTIHCASNCCLDIQGLDAVILIEFLTFECLMFEEYQKENVYVMILNLIKNEQHKISSYLIEFIIDCVALICLKKFSILREMSDVSLIEEEKKSLKTIFQFFEFYFNNMEVKKNSIIKNIMLIYCFFVNYEQKFCWKQMKSCLLQEGNSVFKYFLEIIYSDTISSTFSNLENYFFYDNDEEFGLPSYFDKIYFFENSYKSFLSKLGDCNNIILRHRIKIINGSIFFIGMSLWGYERIESIQIPNTIIVSHFFKLASSSHRKIDQEIIHCLRRLIKKFGDTLTDEWTQIFQILQMIINREKTNLSQNVNNLNNQNTQMQLINDKNILEILDSIKMLIISNKFFGNVAAYSNLLDEFRNFQNESLIFLKTKFKLGSFCKFIANLESLIIENLINSKSERVKNHLIEMIRLNYSYVFHKNQLQTMKKSIIENLISKHFSSLIFSFETAENLNFFSHLITEMCMLSTDIKFFEKILRSIFLLQNDLKFYQNESEKSKILLNFQKNTLINLYSKLSNAFQKEKILLINKKIYSFLDTKNDKSDISFLIVILNFFKNFIVNKDYELFLQEDKIYKLNQLPSQIVINYHYNTIIVSKKNKKVYENLKSKKVNVYEPYIVFKHNKIFDYLINLINQDETNTFVCEEVLDLLLIHLKTNFFFKGLKLEKLLNTIIGIDDIKKYSIRRRFIDLIIEILSNSTFHLNGVNFYNTMRDNMSVGNPWNSWNSSWNNQTANHSNQNSNSMNSISYNQNLINTGANTYNNVITSIINQPAIEITDDSLKDKIINFSINSLKSFSLMMKNMIINYKKIVMNYINIQINMQSNTKSENLRQSMSMSRDKEPGLNGINLNMNLNQNEFQNLYSNLNSTCNFIPSGIININNVTENFVENSQNINNTVSQFNPNSQNNIGSVNLKMTVYYLKRIFNLISVYFSSINVNDNSFVTNTKNLCAFYGYNASWVNFNHFMNTNTNFGNQKKLNESIMNLIEILTEMRNFCFFKLSIAVTILNFILSIKDILINSGEEVIIKTIFLIMNIGFPNNEAEILKHFTDNFNYKFRKYEAEKIRPPEKFMKREYINLLADTCLLYFIESSQNGRILMNIFNLIFKNQSTNTMGSNSPIQQPINPTSSKESQNSNLSPNSNPNATIRVDKNSLVLMRESLFLELAKWQILSKTNRDNIKSEYRSKISQYSQIFMGKQNIIMIIPIDNKTLEVLIRNPIANINMTITSEIDNWEKMTVNNQQNILNNLVNGNNNRINSKDVINGEIVSNMRNSMEDRFSTPNMKIKRRFEYSDNSEFDDEYGSRDSSLFKSASMFPETDDNKEEKPEEVSERDRIGRNFSPNKALYKQTIKSNFHKSNSLGTTDLNNLLNKPSFTRSTTSNIRYPNVNDMSPKNDPKNLLTAHMINNSNIIFQQILNMISEQDIKFQLLENNQQLESYIKSLDNTPVYYTFNCGVIYVPNKNNITEFEIFTYEGETSQRYIKFISSLGKLLSIVDNPQIYTGGLNKTGFNGKYTIYHQDSMFQMVYHIISLIKVEESLTNSSSDPTELTKNPSTSANLNPQLSNDNNKPNNFDYMSQLFNIRKKLIGNDYVNIVWLENPFHDFDSSKIISGAILIYIVVYPISEFHNLIKLKYNKRSKFNIIEKVSNYFTEELCIEADGENLSNYLVKLVITLNLMINYTLQKTAFKNIELERNNSNFTTSTGTGNRYANLHNQIHFDSNLTQRFKEIERINYRFKNSI